MHVGLSPPVRTKGPWNRGETMLLLDRPHAPLPLFLERPHVSHGKPRNRIRRRATTLATWRCAAQIYSFYRNSKNRLPSSSVIETCGRHGEPGGVVGLTLFLRANRCPPRIKSGAGFRSKA